MKIFVTGACGYKGTVLVPKLLAAGHEVVAFDIMWFGNHLKPHPKLTAVKGDVRNIEEINLDGVDAIIHLSSIANDPCGDLDLKLTWEVSALATMQLADKAVRKGVKRFIYASSGSVYDIKDEDQVTEDLELKPISEYNKTKMVAERVLLSYKNDMVVQMLRPATVCDYSPRMRLDVSVNMLTMSRCTHDPDRACSIAYQIASALSETNRYALVHRDIKPSNIMLTGEDQAKLLDFGLTRHLGHRLTVTDHTRHNRLHGAGTSSRRQHGRHSRRHLCLGGTLFWCLTGQLPFPVSGSPVESLTRRLNAPTPSIRDLCPDLPPELDAVVGKMMAQSPEDRFSSPIEVMQALFPFIRASSKEMRHLTRSPSVGAVPVVTLPDPKPKAETFRVLVVDDEAGRPKRPARRSKAAAERRRAAMGTPARR